MEAEKIKKMVGGTFFSVSFVKKDGTVRNMRCRVGVKKHLNANSRGETSAQKAAKKDGNILTVFEINNGYRNILCDNIISLKFNKRVLSRDDVSSSNWEYKIKK